MTFSFNNNLKYVYRQRNQLFISVTILLVYKKMNNPHKLNVLFLLYRVPYSNSSVFLISSSNSKAISLSVEMSVDRNSVDDNCTADEFATL